MKKLVLMFAAVAAISFASCNGSKTETPAEGPDTTQVEDTTAQDSTQDSTAVEGDSTVVEGDSTNA